MKWFTFQQKQRQKKEGLNIIESMKKVHSCEPEQGVFLGESDEETDEESSENYIDY